jgi:uncharacterized protein (TIGR03000 family)
MNLLLHPSRAAVAGLVFLIFAGPLVGRDEEKSDQEAPCKLIVKVLSKAKLEIQGSPTNKTGEVRKFVSPPLKPGKTYEYTLTASWDSTSYNTISRTYKIEVKAGQTVEVDMTKINPKILDDIKVIYVPTPQELVDRMCKLSMVGKDDVVYDLGCGDGRIVITAVEKFGAKKGVGIDYDAKRIEECEENLKKTKVGNKVEFRQGDIFKINDLDQATVIMTYLSDDHMEQLRPILLKTLKPGSRIVSHRFLWKGDPKPDKTETVELDGDEYLVHVWKIGDKK